MIGRLCMVLATVLVGSAAPAVTAEPERPVLASWRGGELATDRFLEVYDSDGEALRAGGGDLESAICKAAYIEIYLPRALAAGLDADPGFLADMAAWRERQLAALYRRRHSPTDPVPDETLRQAYEVAVEAGRFDRPPTVDLDVLFVRCDAHDAERASCAGRLAELSRRLSEGEALDLLITEERQHSGEANGSFRGLPEGKLAPEIQAAAAAAIPGQLGEPLELPAGFARLRVAARHPSATAPFESVRQALEREAVIERLQAWEAQQLERWRTTLADRLPENPSSDTVLAAAAQAEALDHEASFLAAERTARDFALADRAFLQDAEVLPTDDELLAELRDPVRGAPYRRLHVAVAVVPAAAGRAAMTETMSSITDRLTAGADPAATFAAAAEASPELVVRELGPSTAGELRAMWPTMSGALSQLEDQGWVGPLGVADPVTLPDGQVLPQGAAFVALRAAETPPLDEVREKLYREFRFWMGAPEPFKEVMGRRWGFVLSPDAMRPWQEAAADSVGGGA